MPRAPAPARSRSCGRFAIGRIRRAGGEPAAQVNKALVAFIACLLVGVAAFSASTNLHRFAK